MDGKICLEVCSLLYHILIFMAQTLELLWNHCGMSLLHWTLNEGTICFVSSCIF